MTEAAVDHLADDPTLLSADLRAAEGGACCRGSGGCSSSSGRRSTVTFVLSRIVPADPTRLAAGMQAGPEQVEEVRQQLGLDRPLPEQYVDYVTDWSAVTSVTPCRPAARSSTTCAPTCRRRSSW